MTADGKDLMTLAYQERCDLAAFLAPLAPQDWQAQSLCDKWTVKDVVAHVVSYEELSPLGVARRFAKGWIFWAGICARRVSLRPSAA
jgi:uncharacterized protein (TIGR03083 family)